MQIASGSVSLSDATKGTQAKQLASIDLEQLNVYVRLSSEATHAEMKVQEITVQDLGTGAADCADVVLSRWQQPGKVSCCLMFWWKTLQSPVLTGHCLAAIHDHVQYTDSSVKVGKHARCVWSLLLMIWKHAVPVT